MRYYCPSCGDEKGMSMGTGDCGCEVNCVPMDDELYEKLFNKKPRVYNKIPIQHSGEDNYLYRISEYFYDEDYDEDFDRPY